MNDLSSSEQERRLLLRDVVAAARRCDHANGSGLGEAWVIVDSGDVVLDSSPSLSEASERLLCRFEQDALLVAELRLVNVSALGLCEYFPNGQSARQRLMRFRDSASVYETVETVQDYLVPRFLRSRLGELSVDNRSNRVVEVTWWDANARLTRVGLLVEEEPGEPLVLYLPQQRTADPQEVESSLATALTHLMNQEDVDVEEVHAHRDRARSGLTPMDFRGFLTETAVQIAEQLQLLDGRKVDD